MEPTYLIRADKLNQWIVTKWEGDSVPAAIYTIQHTKRGYTCNCQKRATSSDCKHIKMLKEKLLEKDPNVA